MMMTWDELEDAYRERQIMDKFDDEFELEERLTRVERRLAQIIAELAELERQVEREVNNVAPR